MEADLYVSEEDSSPTDTSEDSIDVKVKPIQNYKSHLLEQLKQKNNHSKSFNKNYCSITGPTLPPRKAIKCHKRKASDPRKVECHSKEEEIYLRLESEEEASGCSESQSSSSPNYPQSFQSSYSTSPIPQINTFKAHSSKKDQQRRIKEDSIRNLSSEKYNTLRINSNHESNEASHHSLSQEACQPGPSQGIHPMLLNTDVTALLGYAYPHLMAVVPQLGLLQKGLYPFFPVAHQPTHLPLYDRPADNSQEEPPSLPLHVQQDAPIDYSQKSEIKKEQRDAYKQQKQRNYKNMTRERRIEANARERTRVHTISAAFEKLRQSIPSYSHNQKLSKLSVLRIASAYILTLSRMAGLDYSEDQSFPSMLDCVDLTTRTLQTEGKAKKKEKDLGFD